MEDREVDVEAIKEDICEVEEEIVGRKLVRGVRERCGIVLLFNRPLPVLPKLGSAVCVHDVIVVVAIFIKGSHQVDRA